MRSAAVRYRLREVVDRLGGELVGDGEVVLTQVASLDAAGPSELTFLGRDSYRRLLSRTRAGAVVVGQAARDATELPRIVADNPMAYFARASALFNPPIQPASGTHPNAQVDVGANVHPAASIAAFAVIEAGATVEAGAQIGAGAFVGRDVRIGADSVLCPRVTVYANCVIGRRALLHSGCVIGADGFGGVLEEGRWVKLPQVGRVVIGNDVEIGANTTIDRGTLDDTHIGDGVKLDNQIQVGHNVQIGAHTAIAGCVGIAGSARIGARCIIGGGAIVLGHLSVADGVEISAGTVVTRSIDQPGRYSGMYPFMEHRAFLRSAVNLRRQGNTEGPRGEAARRKESGKKNRS